MRALLVLLFLLQTQAAAADEVYRQVEADGTVRYSDKPPTRSARPVQLAPLSGPKPAKARTFYSAEALRAAARFAVSVESPTPGQVLANDARMVAAASVMPGLVNGFRLVYLLNERAITTAPVEDLSVLMADVAPGDHRLSIVLLDPQGREITRSAETPFRVMAPK